MVGRGVHVPSVAALAVLCCSFRAGGRLAEAEQHGLYDAEAPERQASAATTSTADVAGCMGGGASATAKVAPTRAPDLERGGGEVEG